ncbi:DUF2613 domain-containing protein [Mycobacterium sp. 852002-51057_SCH5723018]|uniref:DUF2613 domain-containing protein n=1 Tax=Mycobacterium sp. 852002-51057_SCH5723018 TaxID=1834094 RepID=UPI0007FDE9D4|nr:DUF2613 domain-containing protein [Mycobacterium sp. 852002-51057_SCH5723018]OBG20629.1 hypothetical protein A5764_01785 [Mycobacterium sp. 852002-51057_SCH5723018]
MTGWTLAAASFAVGLSIGAAATVGVTLAAEPTADHGVAPVRSPATPAGPSLVDYGDRCFHGHCLPCNSKQSCLNQLPPGLRP